MVYLMQFCSKNSRMRFWLAPLILLLLAAGCSTTKEGTRLSELPLRTQSFVADDEGLAAASHLVIGQKECLLVDAQLTRSHARQVVALVTEAKCELRAIFITHAHPDHYLGLEVLHRSFPEARMLAAPEVVATIRAKAASHIAYWKPHYRANLPDHAVIPEPFTEKELRVDGERIQVLAAPAAESEHASYLYIPATQILVAGDLLYNQVHPWLGENRPAEWLRALAQLQRLGTPNLVLSGHGYASDAGVIAANERYLKAFISLTDGRVPSSQATRQLQEMFPKYRLPIFLETSVAMRLKVPSRSSPKSPQLSH
jgi:glyoxylase-like metal-dependent hydrolase (beta-lactamase superfamily II)